MRENRRAAVSRSNRLAVLCLLAASVACRTDAPWGPAKREKGPVRSDKPREAQEFFALKRAPVGERTVPVEPYLVAREHMRRMKRFSTRENRMFAAPSESLGNEGFASGQAGGMAQADAFGGPWSWLGPGNVGGRTRGLVIDPTDPDTMYAGGVAGGVWKTTNAGGSWAPLDDMMANLAVSSLAMDPGDPQTLYAGTGEGFFNFDAVRGAGIFKTVDGGATWTQLAGTNNSDFHYVNEVVVSPVNGQRVYAATRTGVWRSTNGGATFPAQVINAAGVNGCTDLAIRTDQATDSMFAACGTFDTATVYRNTDAGGAGAWQAVLSESVMGRTSLAIAPSNQSVIYALAASIAPGNYQDGLHALFRSTTGGGSGSWTAQVRNSNPTLLNTLLLSNPPFAGGCAGPQQFFNQGWYDNVIAVDPADFNRVWVGGIEIFRSDNGGADWGLASHWWAVPPNARYSHADKHALVFHPGFNGGTNQTLYVGSDGGIFRTDNARAATTTAVCNTGAGNVTWTDLNNNYGVTQFYYGVPYPDGTTYFGGTQDNGTVRGSDGGGTQAWLEILGGDGGAVAVDPTDTQVLYAENTDLTIQKSLDGGASFFDANSGISDSGLFISPFLMDPSEPDRLWSGGRFMWRTDNGAANWTQASQVLGAGGRASAIAVAATDPNSVLAGQEDGDIHRTSGGLGAGSGTNWASVRPRSGYVASVAFDPTNANIAYATYSTFGGTHVWKSTSAGASWSPLDGPGAPGDPGHLPDLPYHAIVVDPSDTQRLYLGSDLGVFVSTDGGITWAVENTGFANVVTEALVENGGELFAFTHGRGAWRVALAPPTPPTISISDVTIIEPDFGTANANFTVSLSHSTSQTVTVQYATIDGTASAPADYTSVSGTLTFNPGQTSKTLAVPVVGETLPESNEDFFVDLSNPTNATLLDSQGRADIVDQDTPGTLQLSSASYSVGESGGPVTITVLRPDGTSGGVTVDYATSDDTAQAGSDYTAKTGTLSFGVGETSKSFTVPITGDSLDEINETFNVTLSNPTGGAVLGTPSSASVTITDDDTAGTLALSAARYTASESGLKATISVVRTGGAASVTIQYATSDGSAAAGSDYTATAGTLSFGAGVNKMSFVVPIANDAAIEGSETLLVSLSAAGGGANLGTPNTAVVTITDSDLGGAFKLSAASYSVKEAAATAIVTVTRTGGSGGPVSVHYDASPGTASAPADFTVVSGELTFLTGELKKTFSIPIVSDGDDEDGETVPIQLSAPTGGATLGSPASATLTITDDDTAGTVQFALASVTAGETAGTINATVSRSGGLAGPVTVDYQVTDGSAGGSDYSAPSGTLSFAQGVLSQTIAVTILDDSDLEGPETVNLALSNPTGRLKLGKTVAAVLTITDDEAGVTLLFSAAAFSVTEGGGAVVTVVRSGPTASAVGVDYATSDGTATLLDGDYTAASGTLSFAVGVSKLTFKVMTTADTRDENNEDINLTLSNPTGGVFLGTQSTAKVNVLDNDGGGALRFSAANYSKSEASSTAAITVTRTGGTAGSVTVQYDAQPGTAGPADFTPVTGGTLTFLAGQTKVTFNVALLPDTEDESNETVLLQIYAPTGGATLGSPTSATLTITDDDTAGSVQFSLASYGVSETGGTATITATRTGGMAGPVTVDYQATDGTATSSDYTATAGTLTFASGVTSQTFTVAITDDGAAEGTETVNLGLLNPQGGLTLGARSSATLAIADDEAGVTLHFSAPKYSVMEGGAPLITVMRSGDTTTAVTVAYATSDGTALLSDGDYTAASGTLNFKAGVKTLTFKVVTAGDTRDETDEDVNLTLSNPMGGATLGTQSTAKLDVLDNDSGGVLAFKLANVNRAENGKTATLTVSRTGGVASNVTVPYFSVAETGPGKATAGLDYTAVSNTLTFGAGKTSLTFTVPILEDALDEPNETVLLQLGAPTGGATLGPQSSSTVTITDNDVAGTIKLSASAYSLNESGGTLTLTITRTGGTADGATIDYDTSDGTATAGSDYQSASGTLTFGLGETTKTIAVTILPDAVNEANETVLLTLSSPGGGLTLGTPSSATLYIVDDE